MWLRFGRNLAIAKVVAYIWLYIRYEICLICGEIQPEMSSPGGTILGILE